MSNMSDDSYVSLLSLLMTYGTAVTFLGEITVYITLHGNFSFALSAK